MDLKEFKNEVVVLDGKKTGIVAQIPSNSKRKKYVVWNQTQDIRLFENMRIAKLIASSIKSIPGHFKYYFKVAEKKMIPIENCQYIDGAYHYIEDNIRYIIKEQYEANIIKIGYFVFDDGDTVRCDKSIGFKRQKELMNTICGICNGLLFENHDVAFDRIEKKTSKELILHVKGTTAKFHIMSNSALMDYNQARKANGEKAIPFIKTMDKFTTLFMYATIDKGEPSKFESREKVDKLIDWISYDLDQAIPTEYPQPNFQPVDFYRISVMER